MCTTPIAFLFSNTPSDFHNNNKKELEMRLETLKYLSHPPFFFWFNKILVSLCDISKARTERHLGLVCKQNVSSARHQVVCSSLKSVKHRDGGGLYFFVRKKSVLEETFFFQYLLTKKCFFDQEGIFGDFFRTFLGGSFSRKEKFYTQTDFGQNVFGLETT